MSIIERALQRHQEQQRQQVPAAPLPRAAAPLAPASTAHGPVHAPITNVLSRETAKRPLLTLDADMLEACGLFAPADKRRRHTHEHRVIKRNLIDLKTSSGTS